MLERDSCNQIVIALRTLPDLAAVAQEVGLGLGAQAGEARLSDVARKSGFTRIRRAAETPFNLVLEAKV